MRQDTAKEPLRIFFNQGTGRTIVMGAGLLALVLILYGFFNGDAVLMLLSLIPMCFSAYHLPALHNQMPQIIISEEHIRLDGLGDLVWSDVEDIDLFDIRGTDDDAASDTPRLMIAIVTRDPVEHIVRPQHDLTLLRTFQIMGWQLLDDTIICLRTDILNVDPDYLFADLRGRLYRSRTAFSQG